MILRDMEGTDPQPVFINKEKKEITFSLSTHRQVNNNTVVDMENKLLSEYVAKDLDSQVTRVQTAGEHSTLDYLTD